MSFNVMNRRSGGYILIDSWFFPPIPNNFPAFSPPEFSLMFAYFFLPSSLIINFPFFFSLLETSFFLFFPSFPRFFLISLLSFFLLKGWISYRFFLIRTARVVSYWFKLKAHKKWIKYFNQLLVKLFPEHFVIKYTCTYTYTIEIGTYIQST